MLNRPRKVARGSFDLPTSRYSVGSRVLTRLARPGAMAVLMGPPKSVPGPAARSASTPPGRGVDTTVRQPLPQGKGRPPLPAGSRRATHVPRPKAGGAVGNRVRIAPVHEPPCPRTGRPVRRCAGGIGLPPRLPPVADPCYGRKSLFARDIRSSDRSRLPTATGAVNPT